MERRGILTVARDTIIPALVGGWRQKADSVLGFIPPQRYGAEHGVIRPGNYESYIRANKGHVANCTRIRGEGVAAVDRKLYITKTTTSTKFPFTRTKEIPRKQRDYVWDVAEKYIQDAAEVVEVVEHPVLELLRKVNIGRNEADLKHETSGWLDITGNCYWYTPFNGMKIPAEIWIIHSQYMKPHAGSDGRVDSYIYKRGNQELTYDVDEIVHFRLPSYKNYYYGEGIIPGAADMIDLRNYMLEYNQSVFKNMGQLGGLIVWKGGSKEILKRRQKEWDTDIVGNDKVGKWVHTIGGTDGADIKEFGMSPKDMGYQEGFFLTLQEICNAYGIPVGMLDGDKGSASRASAKEHERHISKHSILPRVTLMDAVLNEQLLPLYEKSNERLFVLSNDPVEEDKEIAMEERKVNIETGVHTINEERAVDNLEPLPGFDVPWLQMNYMPAGGDTNNEEELARYIVNAVEKAKAELRAGV